MLQLIKEQNMSNNYSQSNKRKIIKETESLLNQIKAINAFAIDCFNNVEHMLNQFINLSVNESLAEISCENLNQNNTGIRTKLLIDNGYLNYKKIHLSSINDLVMIKGISLNSAKYIKNAVEETADSLAQEIKLSLDSDNLNDLHVDLIYEIAKYLLALESLDELKTIKSLNKTITFLNFAKKHSSFFSSCFISKKKRMDINQSYAYLNCFIEENKHLIQNSTQEIGIIKNLPKEKALKDFKLNSIKYIKVIEEIKPQLINKLNQNYGLDEQLYEHISQISFSTEGLKCKLRNYQTLGVKYILSQKHVLLGDEMGLGKTIEAIAAMVALRNQNRSYFIVICPASVLINWEREIKKHSDLTTYIIHGNDSFNNLSHWEYQGGVAIATYESIKFFSALSIDTKIDLLVVDEAHYIKNPKTERTKNCTKLCQISDYILLMTGTPLENNLEEMLNIINILNKKLAMEIKHSFSLYNVPLFKKKISSLYYRRRREDVLNELPNLVETDEWCVMSKEDRKIYKSFVAKQNYSQVRQVSWNNPHLETSSKVQRLLEIIENAKAENSKVIVFSFFLHTTELVRNLIKENCYGPITGATAPSNRQKIIDEFENGPAGSVLISQIIAGGTGLNIQSANIVIICEPQFKPSTENQAISRSYRMGQTQTVFVHRLLCKDTVDEKIRNALIEKQNLFNKYADESIAGLKDLEISEADFKNIFNEEYQKLAHENNN